MACVYQTQAQAVRKLEIAASENESSSRDFVVSSIDSAPTSTPNASPNASRLTTDQGTLDTVILLWPFYSGSQTCLSCFTFLFFFFPV